MPAVLCFSRLSTANLLHIETSNLVFKKYILFSKQCQFMITSTWTAYLFHGFFVLLKKRDSFMKTLCDRTPFCNVKLNLLLVVFIDVQKRFVFMENIRQLADCITGRKEYFFNFTALKPLAKANYCKNSFDKISRVRCCDITISSTLFPKRNAESTPNFW